MFINFMSLYINKLQMSIEAIYHNGMQKMESVFIPLDEKITCLDICEQCVKLIPRHLRCDGPMFERVIIIINQDDNTRQLYTISCLEVPVFKLISKFTPAKSNIKVLLEFYNY